jgi:exodeoxyribonuclease VII small subunit
MSPSPTPGADDSPEPELTYEQARDELVSVVHRLESGGVPLDESLRLWERGEELAGICQRWLDGARARVEAARRTRDMEDGEQAG